MALRRGLTAFQIKILALVLMTLDHLGAFGFEIPVIGRYVTVLRRVGRLAAPLFLFLLVQSIRHTRSKAKFVVRLYLAGVCTELFVTLRNLLLGEALSYFTPGNILFTFFYVALYVLLLEGLSAAWKEKNFRKAAGFAGLLLLSLVPTVLALCNLPYALIPSGGSNRVQYLLEGLWNSVLPSFLSVDYGIGFIVLGAAMYFARTKWRQCLVFGVFCAICILGARFAPMELFYYQSFGFFPTFFDYGQRWMVLALPVMALYNGARGRPCKWFFYFYYPLHREAIHLLAYALAG